MYIAATTYTIQPGKKDEMLAISDSAKQEADSLLMKVPGVTGYYSLVNADGDEGLIMIIYATEAQAKAGSTTPQNQAYMTAPYTAQLLSCIVPGSMSRKVYKTLAQA